MGDAYARIRSGRTVVFDNMQDALELAATMMKAGLSFTLTYSPGLSGGKDQINMRLGINV